MPLLLRTRARHLPRSARQLLHPASSHGAIARIPVLFRALQPARTRPALRRHPHNGIPISIGARFSSINPIPTCPGHVPHGRPPLLAGTARNRLLLIMLNALDARDYPVVSGINLVFGAAVMGINLMIDLTYAFLDPRVRYQ